MARKIANLILDAGGFRALERGQLNLNKGEKAMGIIMTITVALVAGASLAAPVSATNDTLISNLLELLNLRRFDYGKDGKFDAPFVDLTLGELVDHMRRCYRMGPIGEFTDADTEIAAGETKTYRVQFILPVGKWAAFAGRDKNRWGCGRSQVSTFRLEFARSNTLRINGVDDAHGVKLSGALSIDFDFDTVDAKGDIWGPIPHVFKFSDTKDNIVFPRGGLPLTIEEMSSPNTLSNITLKVDDQVIHDQVAPADITRAAQAKLSDVGFFTEESIVENGEQLYDTSIGGRAFADYPTGTPRFRQNVRTQDEVNFRYTFVPLKSTEATEELVSDVATHIRKKEIKAVSEATVRGENIPVRLQPYAGQRLLDRDDSEFEKAPGLYAQPNGAKPEVEAPAGMLKAVRAQVSSLKESGNKKAAASLVDSFAAAVPGTVQSERGFSSGDTATRADRQAKLGLM